MAAGRTGSIGYDEGMGCMGRGEATAIPVNPTIHKTLSDASAFLGHVEQTVYEIEAVLFGPSPTSTIADVKCAEEPPIELLAIGLRIRLESLREQLTKIHGRV